MPLDPRIPLEFAQATLSQFAISSTKPMLGGLSGARVWKCQSSLHGALCLRRWSPAHPTQRRLQFIHEALDSARQQLPFVPLVHRDQHGMSYWLADECLWEVTQWMPGEANYLRQPNQTKLWAAIDALAWLHRVWFDFMHEQSVSPSVAQRIAMLNEWLAMRDLVEQVGQCVRGPVEGAACMSTVRMLHSRGPQLLAELQCKAEERVCLQPVLRDIWSDHVLFEGDSVTGFIDFGTVRMDEPATDLARMLGSLHPFEMDVREAAIERYNIQCPLRPIESSRVDLLDRSGTLLTALQWMQWLVLERRRFAADTGKLLDRWQTALSRMMGEELLIGGG